MYLSVIPVTRRVNLFSRSKVNMPSRRKRSIPKKRLTRTHVLTSKRRKSRKRSKCTDYNCGDPRLGLTPWTDPYELPLRPKGVNDASARFDAEWRDDTKSYKPVKRVDQRVPSLQWLAWRQVAQNRGIPFEAWVQGALDARPSKRPRQQL